MVLISSLAVVAAAAVASASPVARSANVPLAYVSNITDPKNLFVKAQQRIAAMNRRFSNSSGPKPLVNGPAINDDASYVAPVSIGGKTQNLIVDTGSSNTWCGARTACEPTSNGRNTGGTVGVSYGSGSFSGVEYTDKVTYAGLSVARQSIGSATSSTGFTTADGILGFGPVGLTYETSNNAIVIPTFMNNLYTEGAIVNEVLGVYFKPENGSDTNDNNGALTLGGVDTTKYTAPLTYFPALTDASIAAAYYWGLSIASFKYGTTVLQSSATGIIDTGTTLMIIPSTAYSKFLSATGGSTDSKSGFVVMTKKPTQNFVVTFGSTAYPLTPAQYLVPAAQYGPWGLNSTKFYAWIGNGGDGSNGGVNCLIGQKFLENYYSVFDTTNGRIGFATRT